MRPIWIIFGLWAVAIGAIEYYRLGLYQVLFKENTRLGNYVMELEARLPCGPTFELTCGIGEGETGLYQDGVEKRFRYAINGADLGVVRCYSESGKEVLP